ncbi:hypothetical protein PR048_012258 [Dryococelus australis]|uniref:Uncharacterized protein n=1 Tax=Dryococelus australis TaxID=614101 RepID=A0ABQ9HNX5_9NEOP|nr:hypothetical protein PR048_012258 [Dryococelus australis]
MARHLGNNQLVYVVGLSTLLGDEANKSYRNLTWLTSWTPADLAMVGNARSLIDRPIMELRTSYDFFGFKVIQGKGIRIKVLVKAKVSQIPNDGWVTSQHGGRPAPGSYPPSPYDRLLLCSEILQVGSRESIRRENEGGPFILDMLATTARNTRRDVAAFIQQTPAAHARKMVATISNMAQRHSPISAWRPTRQLADLANREPFATRSSQWDAKLVPKPRSAANRSKSNLKCLSIGCCPSFTAHLTERDSLLVPLQVGYWRLVVQDVSNRGLFKCKGSHPGEPGSIHGEAAPGFSHVGIVPLFDGFSQGSPRFLPPFHSGAVPYSPRFTLMGLAVGYLIMKRGQQTLLSFCKKLKNSAAESLVPSELPTQQEVSPASPTRSIQHTDEICDAGSQLTKVKSSLPCSHTNDIGST